MSMLARIGNKLFRMGRYLDRADHMAGYSQAHYLHYLDAAFPEYKEKLLESLLSDSLQRQLYFEKYTRMEEEKLLSFIALDADNPYAIRSHVTKARELARGARDCISAELWEHINCFYHAMNSYNRSRLQHEGFHNFTKKAKDFSLMIKGYTESVMLRDDRWMLLSMGFKLESAIQAAELLRNKLHEIEGKEAYHERDHLIAMLQSTGSYEMYKKFYQQNISRRDAIHFVVFNRAFPKSVMFSLDTIQKISQDINFYGPEEKNTIETHMVKLIEEIQAAQSGVPSGAEAELLEKTISSLHELANMLEQEHLAYIEE